MLRRPIRTAALLLLAAAINLAVAWGAVWLFARTSNPRTAATSVSPTSDAARSLWQREFGPSVFVLSDSEADHATVAPESDELGSNLFRLDETRRDGFGCLVISMSDSLRQAPVALEVLRAGWPLPTLQCERVFRPKKYAVKHAWMAFATNGTRAGGMVLPCNPIWPGAIVNTLFYAALLTLTSIGIASGRRAVRRRADRCISCGYDVRATTSGVCPECGTRRA